VRGSAYLLRINTRAGDTTRHFGCMQAAAEAGLAPRVRYASAEDRVSISDFVEAVPLPAADALRRVPVALRTLHALRRVPVALRTLHALQPFPVAPFNTTCTFLLSKGPALDGFLQKFRAANILPEHDVVELLSQCERLAAGKSGIAHRRKCRRSERLPLPHPTTPKPDLTKPTGIGNQIPARTVAGHLCDDRLPALRC
jgi:hypothetical protein